MVGGAAISLQPPESFRGVVYLTSPNQNLYSESTSLSGIKN